MVSIVTARRHAEGAYAMEQEGISAGWKESKTGKPNVSGSAVSSRPILILPSSRALRSARKLQCRNRSPARWLVGHLAANNRHTFGEGQRIFRPCPVSFDLSASVLVQRQLEKVRLAAKEWVLL